MQISFNSVRASQSDRLGARAVMIGECTTLAFEGTSEQCATFLENIPVGRSVTVRHAGGLRSCMNKPSLWADVRGYR